MKKLFLVTLCFLALTGCSTINFSANYYTPPVRYQLDAHQCLAVLQKKMPLHYFYHLRIVTDEECKGMKGIPGIDERGIVLPDNFLLYVFQNYYEDRMTILACVYTHEIAHVEFKILDQSSAEKHFIADQKAIELLVKGRVATPEHYYKSLSVLRNYWFARKGVAGHLANAGWNVVNATTLAVFKVGKLHDWFATDIDKRMQIIKQVYRLSGSECFPRTTTR